MPDSPDGITDALRTAQTTVLAPHAAPGRFRRIFESDLWSSFSRNPVVVISTVVIILFIGAAVLAPWIAPHDPYDLGSFSLFDNDKPPAWL